MNKCFLFLKCFLLFSFALFAQEMELTPSKSIEREDKPTIILQSPPFNDCFDIDEEEYPFNEDYHFMLRYYKTIESSLNRNERTGKLGKNTIDGKKSGTFSYNCKLTGWNKVIITMIYNDYCDEDFIINGTTIVEVNWMACGTMSGIIYADGPSKAIVEYNLIINESIESDGYYLLCRPENDYNVQVPASVVLQFANRSIVLDENCMATK